MDHQYEVIIIGGGPGGLAAAIYAGRAEMKTLVIEKSGYGGRIKETSEIKNYPGTIFDSGEGLMKKFEAHAKSYPTVEFKRTTVSEIEEKDGLFTVKTKRRGDFQANAVIMNTGTEPRVLGIPGEKEFVGKGVSYCATCDAEFFKDKEIHILGAGDQAIEEAEFLTKFAKKVSIIVLKDEGCLDCNEVAAKSIASNPKVHFIWNATLAELKGEERVESVVIKNVKTGEQFEEPSSGVFFFIGMMPKTELVRNMVDCTRQGFILVNEKQETSKAGLYAIGDCTNTFLRQVITAAADGAKAVVAVERYLKEKHELDALLADTTENVAFIFYNPYQSEDIEASGQLERLLKEDYKIYKYDISRQNLLFKRLGLKETVSAALYESGQLQQVVTDLEAVLQKIKN